MHARTATLSLLAAAIAVPLALAQPSPPAVGADGPAAIAAPKLQQGRTARTSLAEADARACLDYATNLEVIVCAERFRPQRQRAQPAT